MESGRRPCHGGLAAACALILSLGICSAGKAATLTVTTIADQDDGACTTTQCSLRDAVNYSIASDTVVFRSGLTGTITLNSTLGSLIVRRNLTINGPGAGLLTVSGNNVRRVVLLSNGTRTGPSLSLSGLTISGGRTNEGGGGILNDHGRLTVLNSVFSSNGAGAGGAIYNDGSFSATAVLTLTNCAFNNNFASYGGAIYSDGYQAGATANLTGCIFNGNAATYGLGGGIFNDGTSGGNGTFNVSNSTLTSNNADFGGGIMNQGVGGSATLRVTNSTMSSNIAYGDDTTPGLGAGIYNDAHQGTASATVTGCTINGNVTDVGGAIYNDGTSNGGATLGVINSTLSGNNATYGGGIYNDAYGGSASTALTNATLSNNTAQYGAGVYNDGTGGGHALLQPVNTIFANSGINILNNAGFVSSLGHNLSTDNGGGYLVGAGDQINSNPRLDSGGLRNNGGPTQTIALLPGSPAIDRGDNSKAPTTDQRGVIRPQPAGGLVDIGAFEARQFAVSGVVTNSGGTPVSGVTLTLNASAGAVTRTAQSDGNGAFAFAAVSEGTYSLTPSKSGVTFSPTSRTIVVSTANVTGQNFVANVPNTLFSISGRVVTSAGAGISGVTVTRTGSSTSATTDANGNYAFANIGNGTYTLTPAKSGFSFTPTSRSVTVNNANVANQNFTGVATVTGFTISGRVVFSSGTGISGVSVTRTGSATAVVTDANGNYSFTGLVNGTYTITPARAGYTFIPVNKTATVNSANVANLNFTGGFSVAGRIVNTSGAAIVNVAVRLVKSGSTSVTTVVTNGTGNFTFTAIANGTYTITPSLSGYSFTPGNRSVTVNGASVGGQNFTGTFVSYSISGRIADSAGVAVPNVQVMRTGSPTAVFTNSAGYFTFTGVANGTYTITPSKAGVTFTPATRTTTVNGANVVAQNFIGS